MVQLPDLVCIEVLILDLIGIRNALFSTQYLENHTVNEVKQQHMEMKVNLAVISCT